MAVEIGKMRHQHHLLTLKNNLNSIIDERKKIKIQEKQAAEAKLEEEKAAALEKLKE